MNDSLAQRYEHKQEAVQRPDVGVQDQFSTKKPNRVYSYDSSLDPALSWDENRERELGEWLLGLVSRCADEGEAVVFAAPQVWQGGGVQVQSLKAAAGLLQTLSKPFLNWAGKAERHQLSVPTTPLFVHENHSTKAILDGIKSRKAKGTTLDLFGDPQLDVTDRLDAYEHKGPWRNRMILGDSLQVMNSMLEFEGLGGQVQMVFIDPPYGVKFGSNFQPFVRKHGVTHGSDDEMTREPEMVKAYRDTWKLGLHSYLTYLRDRLLLAKELLANTGSVFVQISDENLHHVREVMDEVFGSDNFCSVISFSKTSGFSPSLLSNVADYLIWFARDKEKVRYNQIYVQKEIGQEGATQYKYIESFDGNELRSITPTESENLGELLKSYKILTHGDLSAQGASGNTEPFEWNGKVFRVPANSHWKTTPTGLKRLADKNRIMALGKSLRYKRYLSDFPVFPVSNIWNDTGTSRLMQNPVNDPTTHLS